MTTRPRFTFRLPLPALELAMLGMLAMLATVPAQAQTFTVLHSFTGGQDGADPAAALTLDAAGNLYGTANAGGNTNCPQGCGTVFKISRHGSAWTFNVLYTFTGGIDGDYPETPVVFGPDGSLYGTTIEGGIGTCFGLGCGTVFKLQPQPTFCRTALCPWTKTELYQFTGTFDGGLPNIGSLTFDAAGNIYGATEYTGYGSPYATVYELSPFDGSWTFNVLYASYDGNEAETPLGGVVFDASGNLWGTTYFGGLDGCEGNPQNFTCGIIFELTPSGSGWMENTVFQFNQSVGGNPAGNLIFDRSGNIYGTLTGEGPGGAGGVYQFVPSSGQLTLLYAFSGIGVGPYDGVVMDSAGNLYGTSETTGAYGYGSVFKLTPSNSGWIFTDLHDFTGGSDGEFPYATVTLDNAGNIYGTTAAGTHCYYTCGTVWEITP